MFNRKIKHDILTLDKGSLILAFQSCANSFFRIREVHGHFNIFLN